MNHNQSLQENLTIFVTDVENSIMEEAFVEESSMYGSPAIGQNKYMP